MRPNIPTNFPHTSKGEMDAFIRALDTWLDSAESDPVLAQIGERWHANEERTDRRNFVDYDVMRQPMSAST